MRSKGVVLALLTSVVVTGCGASSGEGAEPPAPSPAAAPSAASTGLSVLSSGYGQTEFRTYAVALLENDDPHRSAAVTATFTAYDSGGQVVGTGRESLALVRAGQTIAVGADLAVPPGRPVARVDTQLDVSQRQEDRHPTAVITGRAVRAVEGPGGFGFRAEGELVSAYAADLGELVVHAICFDASGEVTGGGFTFVPGLPGGGTTPARVDLAVAERPATCDLHATTRAASSPDTA